MILLIGIWISLTKKPIKPIIANPIAVAREIFWNSLRSGLVHLLTSLIESFENCLAGSISAITWSIFLKNKKNVRNIQVVIQTQNKKHGQNFEKKLKQTNERNSTNQTTSLKLQNVFIKITNVYFIPIKQN